MEETNTTQLLQDKFAALPPDLQSAITDSGFVDKLRDMSKTEKLMIDQAGSLEREVLLVLLGVMPLSEFSGTLVSKLRIDQEKAKRINNQVNEQIFFPIRHRLEEIESNRENAPSNIVESPLPTPESEATEDKKELQKQNILSGIENPTPAIASVKTAVPLLQNKTTLTIPPAPAPSKEDLVVNKLTQTIASGAEQVKPEPINDLYRELPM